MVSGLVLDLREGIPASRPVPVLREVLPTHPGPSGGPPKPPRWPLDPFQTFGWAYRLVLDPQEGLQTCPGPMGGPENPSQTSERAF